MTKSRTVPLSSGAQQADYKAAGDGLWLPSLSFGYKFHYCYLSVFFQKALDGVS